MKKSLSLAIILFSCVLVFAQNELIVQSSSKGLYLIHTVVPKENFYSVGRLYNVPPKSIATFNELDMSHGLAIGQIIKIPLIPANFSQSNSAGRPIYYLVGENEGLYRVSTKNNKVLMANLRKWNHLNNDNLVAGNKLIVGYLFSPEANNIVATIPTVPVQQEPEKKDSPVTNLPKKDIAVQRQEQVTETKSEETKKPETVDKKSQSPGTKNVSNPMALHDINGGFFKSQFDLQVKSQPLKADQTASAGIFKTSSGWQDAKYYALMDNIDPGTIIRVVNPTNNKAIYAKVLGTMSGVRQNQGYDVRISNAAASALEISDTDKFIVRVVY